MRKQTAIVVIGSLRVKLNCMFPFQMTDGLGLSALKTPGGAVPKERGRKIGHRRVDEKTGTVTYKKVSEL